MNLNLYDILQNILNESISSDKVNDAIDNKYQVIITYDSENGGGLGKRIIEPYVYGLSSSGNEVVRAYQFSGDSLRGTPKWKLFRLDRIKSWEPTKKHFYKQPSEYGWNAENFNPNDLGMSNIINRVKLDDEVDDGIFRTDFEKQLLNRKKQMQNSRNINISDINTQKNGPINDKKLKNILSGNNQSAMQKYGNVVQINNNQIDNNNHVDDDIKQNYDEQDK